MSSELKATGSFKKSAALLTATELVQPSVEDSKQMASFFGRKNKSPQENAACCLACVINFLKTPDSKNYLNKLEKYMARCKVIISSDNPVESAAIGGSQYLHVALHNLILHADALPFELKKDVYTMMLASFKLSPNAIAYFILHVKLISQFLIQKFEAPEMSFFSGNMLRILLKQEQFIGLILDIKMLSTIIQITRHAAFEIQSEALETFHVIFKQKKPKQKEILSTFLLQNSADVMRLFTELQDTENYLTKRDILLTLNQILSDPINKAFTIKFVNDKENLKRVMNILSLEEQGGIKEVALTLLEHFLQNYSGNIENESVKSILSRNKAQLVQCIKQCAKEVNQENKTESDQRTGYMLHILETI